jgi:hypothetical protein
VKLNKIQQVFLDFFLYLMQENLWSKRAVVVQIVEIVVAWIHKKKVGRKRDFFKKIMFETKPQLYGENFVVAIFPFSCVEISVLKYLLSRWVFCGREDYVCGKDKPFLNVSKNNMILNIIILK